MIYVLYLNCVAEIQWLCLKELIEDLLIAYVNIEQSEMMIKSLINMMKSFGPKVGICGTPEVDTNLCDCSF